MNDKQLDHILQKLINLEKSFHNLESDTTRDDLEKMIDKSFKEVGASGRQYNREYVIDALVKRQQNLTEGIWQAKEFHCSKLSSDNYLLTYTLIQNNNRVTRRSTIWKLVDSNWKMFYHQGTIVQEDKI